ncbi:MAG: hypothetical protein ABIR70_22175 [Bryobacteraceae bacterium]
MNTGRWIAAGLLVGLVLNIGEAVLHGVLLADQTAAAMTALGHDSAGTPLGLGLLVAVTFAQGLVGMWLFANTKLSALAIGAALWVLSGVYSATYFYAGFPGLIPDGVLWWPAAWEIIQYPLAMLAGAAVYRRD